MVAGSPGCHREGNQGRDAEPVRIVGHATSQLCVVELRDEAGRWYCGADNGVTFLRGRGSRPLTRRGRGSNEECADAGPSTCSACWAPAASIDGSQPRHRRPRRVPQARPAPVGYRVDGRSAMSEQGWRGFLAVDGVGDWVVLHGGATAVFRVGSVREAARLAEAIAEVPGFEGRGALLTIADDGLTVRLSRDLWQLEPHHVDLARAVSAVAEAHGAVADRERFRKCSSPSPPRPTPSTSTSGALHWATRRCPTTMPSIRSDTDRRCGCRSSIRPRRCDTRCTSTCRSHASMSRRGSRRRLRRVAAWWTSRRSTGRWRIVPAIEFASARGLTGPVGRPSTMRLIRLLGGRERVAAHSQSTATSPRAIVDAERAPRTAPPCSARPALTCSHRGNLS